MRISELAERSGVSTATIKYYLREGLLPPGVVTSRTQAIYDEHHLDRLRLLRTLREVGDVPVSRLRGLVDAIAEPRGSAHRVLAVAADTLSPAPPPPSERPDNWKAALATANALIDRAGWTHVRRNAPDRENLAAALSLVTGTEPDLDDLDGFDVYLDAADRIGQVDIASLDLDQDRAGLVEQMVFGQVVFGQVLLTLRRLAEEHHSALRMA